ncbi:hypothetical protein ACFYNL_29555 [Streptomyces sp. NPDC007808]|uniref:hypothetical protein n=1 Tax=Streptomyces sp. NPDC007808 TaxID=3364779 RepID=UPI00369FC24D
MRAERTPARARRTLTAVLLCLGIAATPTAVANAGAPDTARAACSLRQQRPHADAIGNVFSFDLYCDNLASDVYGRAAFDAPITGRLMMSPSWFVCWTEGSAPAGESRVWYYTQADRVLTQRRIKGWGVVPARIVQAPAHPYPGLPRCSWF